MSVSTVFGMRRSSCVIRGDQNGANDKRRCSLLVASCGEQGKRFKTKFEWKVLEVHVQERFACAGRTADEHPHADTSDVVLVLQEQETFCGFELEITRLDGRK